MPGRQVESVRRRRSIGALDGRMTMRVFVVQHQHDLDGCDEVKFIGVYSSEDRGWAAVERSRRLPGFCKHPDGFSVDAYEVDKDHWTEGFKTVWLGKGRPPSSRTPSNKPLERPGVKGVRRRGGRRAGRSAPGRWADT